jgi:hypothetical protein
MKLPALTFLRRIPRRSIGDTIGFNVSRLWYTVLLRFPVPAQDKWHISVTFFRALVNVFPQVSRTSEGDYTGEVLVARSLHRVGHAWVEQLLPMSASRSFHSRHVADVLSVALKTMAMPSRVQINRDNVRVTTFQCPLLDQARRTGEPEALVCECTCGEMKSLFKGFSEGFPAFVQYRAPRMMGQGAELCTKEFNIDITDVGE